MKMKKKLVAILGMVLALGLMLTACNNPEGDGNSKPSNNDDNSNNNYSKPSYTEGDVYITEVGASYHYYFSSTPEGLEQAAFDNGISYLNPSIRNASWVLNLILDNNVKKAMDSRGVSYSGTVYVDSGITYVVINRKNGDSWPAFNLEVQHLAPQSPGGGG
jgi:predicted small secreted protein